MPPIKHSQIETNGHAPHERKFPRKELPSDRQFSDAREHMRVRRKLAEYKHTAKEVNSLVDRIESGQESTMALVEWALKNKGSLPGSAHQMLGLLANAHDLAEKNFRGAHTNFVMFSEIAEEMSDGAHAKDPLALARAIKSGKEAARLGETLVQARGDLEKRIGSLQEKITATN